MKQPRDVGADPPGHLPVIDGGPQDGPEFGVILKEPRTEGDHHTHTNDEQPILGIRSDTKVNRTIERGRFGQNPDPSSSEPERDVGRDKDETEGQQDLGREVVLHPRYQKPLHQRTHRRHGDDGHDRADEEVVEAVHHRQPDERANKVERAVSQVQHAHQAIDEREARCEQEEHGGEGEPVEGLLRPVLHLFATSVEMHGPLGRGRRISRSSRFLGW